MNNGNALNAEKTKKPLVGITDLRKLYSMGQDTIEVLSGITLEVAESEMVLVTGESGSGKSTFLNMIGGLDTPTSGSVMVAERDIAKLPESRLTEYRSKSVGFIFQFHYLLKDFTALENVMMPLLISGDSVKETRERARALLADIGLGQRQDHYPSQLSGGERQRVAVARALIHDPSLILADEPTGNLDEKNSKLVLELLFDLVRKYNRTMIMVTHDLSIRKNADRSFLLVHGRLAPE
ncbi:MAG: ABC transporter ATP-binding protein [Spirochaetaceae bacterium]|nr:MAG: ABC transporter ATP-binding protein [Spirochaetaceae bacterium]